MSTVKSSVRRGAYLTWRRLGGVEVKIRIEKRGSESWNFLGLESLSAEETVFIKTLNPDKIGKQFLFSIVGEGESLQCGGRFHSWDEFKLHFSNSTLVSFGTQMS